MPVITVDRKVLDVVKEKYQILEIIDFMQYDRDLESLERVISKYQSHVFQNNERIVVLHGDTDYYPSLNGTGFALYNLFQVLNKYHLPLDFIMMFTNNYGIDKEVAELSKQVCNSEPMKVIYTALWYDYASEPAEQIEHFPIKHLYTCLNGMNRSHRLLTLSYLREHNLLDMGVVSYHFTK